jgi:hypothetical protein
VFIAAVTRTASADYTAEQVQAWAQPERRDVGTWHRAMLARHSFVATIGGELAGFSDVRPDGYLDMMYVLGKATAALEILATANHGARDEPHGAMIRSVPPGECWPHNGKRLVARNLQCPTAAFIN